MLAPPLVTGSDGERATAVRFVGTRRGIRRYGLPLLSAGLAALALWYACRDLDAAQLAGDVGRLQWRWIAAAVCFDLLSYLSQGWRWSLLLHPLGNLGVGRTTRAIYAGLFVNEMLPLRPGEALRALLAAKEMHRSVLEVIPSIVMERIMDGLWLAVVALMLTRNVPLPPAVLTTARGLFAVLCLAVGVLLVAGRIARRSPNDGDAPTSRVAGMAVALRTALSNSRALLVSAGLLAGQGLAFWALARACRLPVGLAEAAAVMTIVRLCTIIPLAPANAGSYQLAVVLALSLFGVTKAAAASFSVIVFVVLTGPLWFIGILALGSTGWSWRRPGRFGPPG